MEWYEVLLWIVGMLAAVPVAIYVVAAVFSSIMVLLAGIAVGSVALFVICAEAWERRRAR